VALGAAFLLGIGAPLALAGAQAGPAAATPGVPDHLVILGSPPAVSVSGVPFGGPIIEVADSTGAIVTTDQSTTVTLSITGGTPTSGAGTLGGCTQGDSLGNTEVNGMIEFSGCAVTGVGTGFKIHAAGTSGAITLTAADTVAFNTSSDVR